MAAQSYTRLFTVDEANCLIPALQLLVERVFEKLDLLRNGEETTRREGSAAKSRGTKGPRGQSGEIQALSGEIRDLVQEIQKHGCLFKGLDQGLVDFPCFLGGEIVFLCWRYGEKRVSYWHRIEDGFSGRRPLLQPDGDGGNLSYH